MQRRELARHRGVLADGTFNGLGRGKDNKDTISRPWVGSKGRWRSDGGDAETVSRRSVRAGIAMCIAARGLECCICEGRGRGVAVSAFELLPRIALGPELKHKTIAQDTTRTVQWYARSRSTDEGRRAGG